MAFRWRRGGKRPAMPKFKKDEPNWITGDLGDYSPLPATKLVSAKVAIAEEKAAEQNLEDMKVQQSDLLKPMLMDVVRYGLNYAMHKYDKGMEDHDAFKYTGTKNPKHVIIIGAGMAGLSAAYELTKVGHNVTIVEMQRRYGGRVKTVGEPEGFAKHCYADAGAMRLPDVPEADEKSHFLTDYYAANEFGLNLLPFNNYDANAYYMFYDKPKMTVTEWNDNSDANFSAYWPGWDTYIKETGAKTEYNITSIDTYVGLTTNIVANQLRKKLLAVGDSIPEQATIWNEWIANWSQFAMNEFLQGTLTSVQQKLDEDHQLKGSEAEKLNKLIPWPVEAIEALSVFSYGPQLNTSLVQMLRDQLGHWWSPNMHRIDGGSHKIPEAFVKRREIPDWGLDRTIHLEEKIVYNVTAKTITYEAPDYDNFQTMKVKVEGYYTTSGQPYEVEGDAVIVTVPLNLVRQIKFVAKSNTAVPDALVEIYKAVEDVYLEPSTKIMVQCKDRFWEPQIKGGFTKTNLPISQVHYPSHVNNPLSDRGILMCYVWKSEAHLFAALNPIVAIREVVRQLAEIHPEIESKFEVGYVQAWSTEPSSQGAFALALPYQFSNVQYLMMNPCLNMFFAGDAISFCTGWMQGALESGLRAAMQFYWANEKSS